MKAKEGSIRIQDSTTSIYQFKLTQYLKHVKKARSEKEQAQNDQGQKKRHHSDDLPLVSWSAGVRHWRTDSRPPTARTQV